MWTVSLASLKGGVGKSTSVVHLALALARKGKRVLVIDLDHQAAATNLLGARAPKGTLDVLLGGESIADVAVETPWKVDVVTASETLARAELALVSEVGREAVLRNALEAAPKNTWDVCLLDTPPSLGLMTVNALAAADAILSPVVPAYLSLLAVKQLENTVATVQKRINPKLHSLGYLLCAVDGRERLSSESREALAAHVGTALWPQEVRTDVRLKLAPDAQVLKGRGAKDYQAVALELLKRLKKLPS